MNKSFQPKICIQKILPIHQDEFNNYHKYPEYTEKLKAAFFTKKLWPAGSKIKVAFLSTGDLIKRTDMSEIATVNDLDPLQLEVNSLSIQEAIKKIVKERIQPIVNLDISFVDDPKEADVRISFDPDGGSWSLIGTDHLQEKEKATMNFGWFDVPTIIHEFGHLIGLIHEHQNPKGKQIMWDEKKVIEWAKDSQGWSEETTRQNIINKYDKSSINGSDFDPLSIMLYFFPASLTTNNVGTDQNFRLSGQDVIWIDKMYHKDGQVSPENFYKNTYGVSLDSSVSKSKEMLAKFGETQSNTTTFIILISIGIGIVVIFLMVISFLKFKRKN